MEDDIRLRVFEGLKHSSSGAVMLMHGHFAGDTLQRGAVRSRPDDDGRVPAVDDEPPAQMRCVRA